MPTSHVRVVEGFTVFTTQNFEVIDTEVGWLGSFPKPAYASLIIKIQPVAATGASVSGMTVTASIYNASDGTPWQTVVMPEVSTAGVYRGVFRISTKDPLGTYPVYISASMGMMSTSYSGYFIVYAGTPGGISFH